jgi:AAA family ATP:ADP antiporter
LLLFFIIQGLDLPGWVVTGLIILFSLLWLQLARHVRREYIRIFSRRIEEAKGTTPESEGDPFDFSRASVLEGLKTVLRDGTSTQKSYVIRKLTELRETRLYADVVDLLSHEDDGVVLEALKYLGAFRRSTVELRSRIESLIQSESQDIQIQAFEYLIRHGHGKRHALIKRYLNDDDYRIRIAAMVSLAASIQYDPLLREAFGLDQLIRERYRRLSGVSHPEEHRSRLQGILLAMGYSRSPEFFPIIAESMLHQDRGISASAFRAAGKTADPYFVPRLLSFLADTDRKESASAAITDYGAGIVPALQAYARREDCDPMVLRALPGMATRISGYSAIDLCFDLLIHDDTETRSQAIHALSALKQQYPRYKVDKSRTIQEMRREARLCQDTLSILYTQIRKIEHETADPSEELKAQVFKARQKVIGLLEKKLDTDLETLFQLLGLHYATDEFYSAYQVLKSDVREMRSDALEYLDNMIEPNLKRVLLPILEVAAWDGITEDAIRKLKIQAPSEHDCFRMILQGKGRRLKLAVLDLIQQLHSTEYITLLDLALNDNNPDVRASAIRTREMILADHRG